MTTLSLKPLYTAEATAHGGRTGTVKSSDGILDLKLVTPKGLGGSGGPHTNPEQLFAAGYSACFIGAMGAVCRQLKVALPADTTVTGVVHIGPIPTGFGLEVELKVRSDSLDKETLTKIVTAAHQVCPYSAATRGNVNVHLTIL
ncbi:organic hydroperoxide resistance protein [Entophlyctis helioformis]|nr:organic hydroperoxide resistance protein [Entophlyctis helioformis]KAI8929260.1 organic hydroperoxide resistance protein [Entophlyctis helioformis]